MSEENPTPAVTRTKEEKVIVSIVAIKEALKKGITRRTGDSGYKAELGSIQEMYGMTRAEINTLFQDARLKGLKVVFPKESRIVILEDIATETPVETPVATTVEPTIESIDDLSGTEATDFATQEESTPVAEEPTVPTANVTTVEF
tara:strand:- start:28129 stop:28566 length:438 start_codon:yes stop_codon:yes gene_type:complete